MPPQQQPGPSSGIKWNEVTWYSKSLAVLLFVGLVIGAFYFGTWYQRSSETPILIGTSMSAPSTGNDFDWISISDYAAYPPTFIQQDGQVYINSQSGKKLIPSADAQSFYVSTILDTWAKDTNNVYFTGSTTPVTGADPSTFTPVAGGFVQYARDKSSLYCALGTWSDVSRLANGDPASFQILYTVTQQVPNGTSGFDYAKDKNNVYVDCEILEGADPSSFKIINAPTYDAQDKDHEYLQGRVVQ